MEIFDNYPDKKEFKRPLTIFEAINNKIEAEKGQEEIIFNTEVDEKPINKKNRIDFLFPIRFLF